MTTPRSRADAEIGGQARSVSDRVAPEASCGPVRIAYVINTLTTGGTERHLSRVAESLNGINGWSVSVYCLARRGMFVSKLEEAGVAVSGLTDPWSKSPTRLLRTVWDLFRFFRKQQPTIVQCYLPAASLLAAFTARAAGVPLLVTSRRGMSAVGWGPESTSHLRRSRDGAPFWHAALRLIDRLSDAVVAVSEAVRLESIREGTPDHKIVTIHNSVSIPPPGPFPVPGASAQTTDGGSPVFGSVGSLRPVKGHRWLIQSFALVVKQLPQARLIIVGEGPEGPGLARLASELGVVENVSFLGERPDVMDILPQLDVFVLPSLSEGMPNSVLEAMAAGVPVVASAVGGVPEVVQDGFSGWLVEPGSRDGLARAMVKLGQDTAVRAAMARHARQIVTDGFSPEQELQKTRRLYCRLLAEHGYRSLRNGSPDSCQ